MPAVAASAPGKIILFGEHAVVYSRPAIAIPLSQLKATAYFNAVPKAPSGNVKLNAPDIGLQANLQDLPENHAIRVLFQLVQEYFKLDHFPAMSVKIHSEIPQEAGFGSGTAVSVALIRGLSLFLGTRISTQQISGIAFEVEKIYHGTPSGVDNTVIAYEKPVYFIKDFPPEAVTVGKDLLFLIADSGIKSETSQVVGDIGMEHQKNPDYYENLFDSIASITIEARQMLSTGNEKRIGELMNQNHQLLIKMGVSNNLLNRLTAVALQAGALGAKLSGAGRGGSIIALVPEIYVPQVRLALETAGAKRVIQTTLHRTEIEKVV